MSGSTVLITGANQGIGLALAKAYAKQPNCTVVGTCRDLSKGGELTKADCKVVPLDVTSDFSCSELPKRLSDIGVAKIDILVNNAGIMKGEASELSSTTLIQDTLEQLNTNTVGPLRVSLALLPLLRKAAQERGVAKTATISSRMGSISDLPNSGGYVGYRASKAAANMITVTLAKDLEKDNILALSLHPGHVSTQLGKKGEVTPDEVAQQLISVVEKATRDDCNRFINRDGKSLPW